MTPARLPLTTWRNGRFVEELPFTGPIFGGVEAPVDFTGWQARMQIRLYGAAAGDPIITLLNVTSDVQGVWIIEPSQGIIRVRVDQETLAAAWAAVGGSVEPGEPIKLKYDLLLTPPTGGGEPWAEGDFIITPGVTM